MGLAEQHPRREDQEPVADQGMLTALFAALELVQTTLAQAAPGLLERLRALLSLDAAILYRVCKTGREFALVDSYSSGLTVPHKVFARELETAVHEMPAGWDLFSPRSASLRDAPLALPPCRRWFDELCLDGAHDRFGFRDARELQGALVGAGRIAQRLDGTGLGAAWQLRVLICEPDGSICVVAGFRENAPEPHELALFDALAPALRKRLAHERQLERGAIFEPVLRAALEQIARAAFVVDPHGALVAGNELGLCQYERDPGQTAEALRRNVEQGANAGFTVTEIPLPGAMPLHLVLAPKEDEDSDRLLDISSMLGLTQRQIEVFKLLVRGEPNKSIAAALGCAERTVEAHITAMLKKARVDSRAMLVALHFSRR
jgi:DNA-binding CsgD family transcriptional regulator